MLGQELVVALVLALHLAQRVAEGLEHRDARVPVHVCAVVGERVHEVEAETGKVALPAAPGGGDDRAVGPGQGLDERARGAGRVDERDAAVAETCKHAAPVVGCQIRSRDVEARGAVAEGPVPREQDDEVVRWSH